MVGSALTRRAHAARGPGLDGHAVAHRDAGHGAAGGVDCPRGFVAHDDACGGVDGLSDAAVLPEVDLGLLEGCGVMEGGGGEHVAAADADVGDADEDIVGSEGWELFVF